MSTPPARRGFSRPTGGRPVFEPSEVERRMVRLAVGFGMPQERICQAILNPSTGKPIDEKTLRKAFAEEIRMGAFEMDMLASSSMAQQIRAGAGWAVMFYMKNRMRWADRDSLEMTGKGGGPIDQNITVEFVRAPKRPA
jgi:hypothetical protein